MIVLRAPDFAFVYEGWWFTDIGQVRLSGPSGLPSTEDFKLVETDRFERRDSDGATAKVWEIVRV